MPKAGFGQPVKRLQANQALLPGGQDVLPHRRPLVTGGGGGGIALQLQAVGGGTDQAVPKARRYSAYQYT